jgi:hypothetical protein
VRARPTAAGPTYRLRMYGKPRGKKFWPHHSFARFERLP